MATLLLFGIVSRVKFRVLREPLVFSDLSLAKLAIKHPQLYIAYLGYGRAAGATIITAIILGLLLWQEQPIWSGWLGEATGFVLIVLSALAIQSPRPVNRLADRFRAEQPTGDPEIDLPRFGLFGNLPRYAYIARDERPGRQHRFAPKTIPPVGPASRLPTVIAVQAESFFDPRILRGGLPHDLLVNFDRLAPQSAHGPLAVGGWGANTMRAEFGFLSGLEEAALGYDRFNPYYALARQQLDSLAWVARSKGYRTICLHPYPAAFFGRDVIYPNLGFHEFHDLTYFKDAARQGPYIADTALADYAIRLAHSRQEPLFIFIITIENHGPWTHGRLPGDPATVADVVGQEKERSDFSIYLQHLRSGDRMLGQLADFLEAEDRGGLLAYYGDHLPSFPHIFKAADIRSTDTRYLLWQQSIQSGEDVPLSAARLGQQMRDRILAL
ncbi:LTA synthase family protein [Lacibacterium aquatile]|uniref:LTA synthase family protein n=1 Tax=Lacibacterium aquatile TaxID=1168082 RepID=A0ABW5DZD4_9PROT